MCTLDKEGRPWVSILAGEEGQIGYIYYPARNTLEVEATSWEGDAFFGYFDGAEDGQRSPLCASVGIGVSMRTRNKFAGRIEEAQLQGKSLKLTLKATQAISNCPKYITIRDLHPHPNTSCAIRRRNAHMTAEERLPDDMIQFILNANSSILGTVYEAPEEDALPSDGRTTVLPDYSGERIMTSLGNIEVAFLQLLPSYLSTPPTFFTSPDERRTYMATRLELCMPLQNLLTEIYFMGTLPRDAFPAQQARGVSPQPSPYNSPLRYLAEVPIRIFSRHAQTTASLTRVQLHTPTIATSNGKLPQTYTLSQARLPL
ncbi:hypothetical protein CPC08DRAFT_770939 [Agrocybe pediades]|nr:hypothetical protein CPC08DRAFT_770939 [Agrocybe pediades]